MRHRILRLTRAEPGGRRSLPTPLAALVVAAFAAATGGPARGGESVSLQGSSESGYPRSSDQLPPVPAPPDWGDPNSGTETYDTNWIIDADRGDENAIWYMVAGATIYGTAHVSNDDDDEVQRLTKAVWGEDRIRFTVPADAAGDVTIHLTNQIAMDAAWNLDAKGDHFLYLDALARDFKGGSHLLSVLRSSTCPTEVTTKDVQHLTFSLSGSESLTISTEEASAGSGQDTSAGVDLSSETHRTTTSGNGDTGSTEYRATVSASLHSTSCSVVISSTENATVSTRSMEAGHETYLEVPKFDTVNVISAAYTVVPVPGTPGGGVPPPSGGPGTPGGDTGGTVTTPGGGTEPTAPGGSGSGGTAPAEEEPEGPVLPPQEAEEPEEPDDGFEPPPEDDAIGGATLSGDTSPASGDGGTSLGGDTGTSSGGATAPAPSGSDPAPFAGTGPADGGGSLPGSGPDPLEGRESGGTQDTVSGGAR